MKIKLSLLTIFLFCTVCLHAQYRAKASLGFGIVDVYHVGFEYQFQQAAIGGTFGIFPNELPAFFSSLNYYYHFAGKSKYSEVKPWFGRVGMFLIRDKNTYFIDHSFVSTIRIGRDINFNNHIGMSLDAGASIFTYRFRKVLFEDPFPTGMIIPVLPAGSIKLFYRFNL